MYAVADSARALGIIDRDLRTAPDYAKSFGAPVSFLTAYSQRALKDLGYDAWRTLGTYSAFDREKYYTAPPTAAQLSPGYIQHADSSMTGAVSQYGRHVRNMKEYVPHDWTLRIVGPPDSNSTSPLHLPKVAHNMRRLIEQRRGNDTRVINMFIHDLKSGGSGFYAGEGLNADELGRNLLRCEPEQRPVHDVRRDGPLVPGWRNGHRLPIRQQQAGHVPGRCFRPRVVQARRR
jgi:hypothetical protein